MRLHARHAAALSIGDVVRLRMDEPTNPMVVTAALALGGVLGTDELTRIVERRLLPHARFRQRVVDAAWPRWTDDPAIDARAHVSRAALPAASGDAELADTIADIAAAPLDRARPLWHLVLVEGDPRGSIVVARVHHAIADGRGLVSLLGELTDPLDAGPPSRRPPRAAPRTARPSPLATARRLGRSLFAPSDPDTPLRVALGVRKALAWTAPVPLDTVKRIADATSGHASDALLAAVAGAVRARLLARAVPEPLPELHALVPVATPRRGARELGNHYASVFVALPVGLERPADRLAAVHARMLRARDEAAGSRLALGALGALGLASAGLEHLAVRALSHRATLTFSSVAGPPARVALGGQAVEDAIVWAPTSGDIGLALTAFGYAGRVRVAAAVDAHLAGEARAIARAVEDELAALANALGVPTLERRCRARSSPSPSG